MAFFRTGMCCHHSSAQVGRRHQPCSSQLPPCGDGLVQTSLETAAGSSSLSLSYCMTILSQGIAPPPLVTKNDKCRVLCPHLIEGVEVRAEPDIVLDGKLRGSNMGYGINLLHFPISMCC